MISEQLPKILILAGGGGHTSIALALAQSLNKKASLYFLIPRNDKLSRSLLEPYGIVDELMKSRYPSTPNYYFIPRLLFSFFSSLFKIKNSYQAVVSTGSNFCIPPSFTAFLKRIPVFNIESRVALLKPSKTAYYLQYFSKVTFLQWEEQSEKLKGVYVGPIFPVKRFSSKNGGYFLVTGGTEGFKELFDTVSKLNLEKVVMQTGKIDPREYTKKRPNWTIFSYSSDFEKIVSESSLVITHQGGGTIFEALMYNKPIIIAFNNNLPRTATREDVKKLAERTNAQYIDDVDETNLSSAIQSVGLQIEKTFPDGREKLTQILLSELE
jgi:UDP-N-acetylglucosamine--N-acetylmuramyl-(pentapeptide) pyrophosphoryl-undecaprenol N-acetylglucosamine transferase